MHALGHTGGKTVNGHAQSQIYIILRAQFISTYKTQFLKSKLPEYQDHY